MRLREECFGIRQRYRKQSCKIEIVDDTTSVGSSTKSMG